MIEIAGGHELLGVARGRSAEITWRQIEAAGDPEHVVVMPCGWDLPRGLAEADTHGEQLTAIGAEKIHVVDAAASFSRPGPRLVDGTELLAHLFHSERQGDPGTVSFAAFELQGRI